MRQIGRYRLDQTLGSGAFATVWKGFDPELDATVAVKVLADNWSMQADVRERFLSEARVLRRTESRRVVRVHDVGVAEGRPYFVMDYVEGGTLAELVGTLEPAEAVRLAVEAAEAVHVLHEAGFLHRDIKPSNLLVDRTSDPFRVVVADLGSAKRLADASGFTVMTGTPAYMAPEQAEGLSGLDRRADVYALAVVSWELITGVRPTRDPGTRLSRRAFPREITETHPGVADVLTAALDPDPKRRPADAAAFARALLTADAGQPSLRDWPPVLVWSAAATVFLVAALVGWLLN